MGQGKPVLVIGGGPAGLAAAVALGDAGAWVVLVERDDMLGGRGVMLSCKATDRCRMCNACLVPQLASQVEQHENVRIILNAVVEQVRPTEAGLEVVVGGELITCSAGVVAVGYDTIDLTKQRQEYGYGIVDGVLPGLQFEEKLRKGEIELPAKVGFIQCVGSRDSTLERDYCSRICCGYALRLARAVRHKSPDSECVLFYQDIQPAGKHFPEVLRATLEEGVSIVRGLPAKVYANPVSRHPTVCYMDTLSGEQDEETFDIVVLSIGLWPPKDDRLAEMLGLRRDEYGFFCGSAIPGVFVAGTCSGPMDVQESIASGQLAAARVLRLLGAEAPATLVLGSGETACRVVEQLVAHGAHVTVVSENDAARGRLAELAQGCGIELVPGAQIRKAEAAHGEHGQLLVRVRVGPEERELKPGRLIAAEEWLRRVPSLSIPGSVGISDFDPAAVDAQARVVFLMDSAESFDRAGHSRALKLAAQLGPSAAYVCRNRYVGEPELEAALNEAMRSGVRFHHYAELPEVGDGRLVLRDQLAGKNAAVELGFDVLVVDEVWEGGEGLEGAAGRLGVDLDRTGGPMRLAKENVHLGPVGSNLRLVDLVGPARGHETPVEIARAAELAAARTLLRAPAGTAEVDAEKCATCLTCLRVCPHGAPATTYCEERKKTVSHIDAAACQDCGACVALCPAKAIGHRLREDEAILAELGEGHV